MIRLDFDPVIVPLRPYDSRGDTGEGERGTRIQIERIDFSCARNL